MNDLRLALRQMARQPGFALVAILTLALGIGANTAIFSVIHAVLVQPFPYVQAERIAFVAQAREGQQGTMPVTWLDYLEWKRQATRLEHLAWVGDETLVLTGTPEPAYVRGAAMTASAWDLLGVAPEIGTTFSARHDAPGADLVAVISHAAWQKHFAGAPDVVGRRIELDDRSYSVLGVMPPTFKFWAADVWIAAGAKSGDAFMQNRLFRNSGWVVGRIAPGATLDDADRELDVISARIAQQFPDSNKGVNAETTLLADSVAGQIRPALLVLSFAVGCLLLIACVNVANLVLARAATREREFSVRAAIGASRGRLLRQVVAESLPLALLGGTAGVALAWGGLRALLVLLPEGMVPAEARIELNASVLLFALGLCLACTLAFGAAAVLARAVEVSPEALREGGGGTASRRAQRVRGSLVVAEVALAVTLLVGAGLLLRSLDALRRVDLGFETRHLLIAPLRLPERTYPEGAQATAVFQGVIERLRGVPGVAAIGAGTNVAMTGGSGLPLLVEGETYTDLNALRGVQFGMVAGDFFRAQGLQLRQGRFVGDDDRAGGEPVIVLNEAAVRMFLPQGDPLGKRVMLGVPQNLVVPGMLPAGLDTFQWTTVVGVVSDLRHFGPASDPPPVAYLPVAQSWNHPAARNAMTLVLRAEGDPQALVPALREAVWAVDRDQPVPNAFTMDQALVDVLRPARFNSVLVGIFAGLALLLSAVGIYGVVAWHVAQRVREIGVRLALGARREVVLRQVVGQGMRVVLIGIAFGSLGAVGAGFALQRLLFGVGAFDPWSFGGVLGVLLAAALLACWLPARRAAAVDPVEALRGA
jgi:putative ABC transport system permease protein